MIEHAARRTHKLATVGFPIMPGAPDAAEASSRIAGSRLVKSYAQPPRRARAPGHLLHARKFRLRVHSLVSVVLRRQTAARALPAARPAAQC